MISWQITILCESRRFGGGLYSWTDIHRTILGRGTSNLCTPQLFVTIYGSIQFFTQGKDNPGLAPVITGAAFGLSRI